MKKTMYAISLFFYALLLAQCNGCKENKCGTEYETRDGVCFCPEGKYEMNNFCRGLIPNEYYGASSENCNCQDTAFFLFKEKTPDLINGGYNVEVYLRWRYKTDPNFSNLSLRFSYEENNTGVWLYGHNGITPGCPVNGDKSTVKTYNAHYITPDSIHLWEISETQKAVLHEERDTCLWILRR